MPKKEKIVVLRKIEKFDYCLTVSIRNPTTDEKELLKSEMEEFRARITEKLDKEKTDINVCIDNRKSWWTQ